MPLDVAGFKTKIGLLDVAANLGIMPIPMAELESHKAIEVAKNPPSAIGRFIEDHQAAIQKTVYNLTNGCVALVPAFAATAVISAFFAAYTSSSLMLTFVSALMIFPAGFAALKMDDLYQGKKGPRFRGSARWHESSLTAAETAAWVPFPIRAFAEDILVLLPDADLIIGELIQDEVVIDPYLLVQYQGEKIVLGIWNDRGVIRLAKQY